MLRQLLSPEHGYSSLRYETCSDSCHRLMTMDREGKKHASFRDDGPSIVIPHSGKKHAPSNLIIS